MGLSDSAVLSVINALLEDLGIVTHDDMLNVLDRHKIKKEISCERPSPRFQFHSHQ